MEDATGIKIGAKIRIAGVVSMKHPTMRSSRLMSNKITILESDTVINAFATIAGICSMVITFEKAVAHGGSSGGAGGGNSL